MATLTLSAPQRRALRALDEEGSYGQFKAHVAPRFSPNWYHAEHRPGNLYVDYRTANVLIRRGLAEVKWNRLHRTPYGTAVAHGRVTCDCMTEDLGDGLGERVVTHSLTCPEHPEHEEA